MDKTASIINDVRFTMDYFMQDGVCRFCWRQNAIYEITWTKSEIPETNLKSNLLEIILDLLDISLTPDSLPNKVCKACLDTIENFHAFKCLCKKADKKLQELFQNVKNERPVTAETPPCDVKEEKEDINLETSSQTQTIDHFLDSLYTSDHASDDEIPLKLLKKKRPIKKQTKKQKKAEIKCCICFRSFKTVELFKEHNSIHHGIVANGFKCFGCEKILKTRRARVGHEAKYCKYLKDGYMCPKCGLRLPARGMYEKHMNNHRNNGPNFEDVLKCKKCEQRFETVEELKKHKDVHSLRKRKYICETCGKVFSRHDYLYKHRQIHTGVKDYECSYCGFRTSQKSGLTIHIRKHTGERPFACDLCPQQCVSSSNLIAHRRRHLGLKNYQCTICDKKFGYKLSLEEHFTTHDRTQNYPCSYCSATYTRVRGLRRHILTKHSKEAKSKEETERNDKGSSDAAAGNSNLETSNDVELFVKNALGRKDL